MSIDSQSNSSDRAPNGRKEEPDRCAPVRRGTARNKSAVARDGNRVNRNPDVPAFDLAASESVKIRAHKLARQVVHNALLVRSLY